MCTASALPTLVTLFIARIVSVSHMSVGTGDTVVVAFCANMTMRQIAPRSSAAVPMPRRTARMKKLLRWISSPSLVLRVDPVVGPTTSWSVHTITAAVRERVTAPSSVLRSSRFSSLRIFASCLRSYAVGNALRNGLFDI